MFSLIIVTWNNLPYLKVCIDAIKKNSVYDHEILIHINEGRDGTEKWVQDNGFTYTKSDSNVGLPQGANLISEHATKDFVCMIDDDIYVLPYWDECLINFREEHFEYDTPTWVASVRIEPEGVGNPSVISPFNYGRLPNFNEQQLLSDYLKLPNPGNMVGVQQTPLLLLRKHWEQVGGYPTEFGKGIGSEEGLAKRMWDIGCRNYVDVGSSLVYHFQRTSTKKLDNYTSHAQNRELQFKKLFGMTSKEFKENNLNWRQPWVKR